MSKNYSSPLLYQKKRQRIISSISTVLSILLGLVLAYAYFFFYMYSNHYATIRYHSHTNALWSLIARVAEYDIILMWYTLTDSFLFSGGVITLLWFFFRLIQEESGDRLVAFWNIFPYFILPKYKGRRLEGWWNYRIIKETSDFNSFLPVILSALGFFLVSGLCWLKYCSYFL